MATTVIVQPVTVLTYTNTGAQQQAPAKWAIELCEVGECGTCCLSCFCPCCALASARTLLDGSDWWVNCCCLGPSAARYLIRTSYNIEGNAQWDCWTGLFCPCCTANQVYQTAKQRGRTVVQNAGPQFNTNERIYLSRRGCIGIIYDMLYSLICLPCAVGYTLESSGVPCWFGACCFSPLAAVSVQRYTRRIRPTCGNECCEDCLLPGVLAAVGAGVLGNGGQVVALPFFWRAFIEENAYKSRSDCLYGLDLIGCCSYSCGYLAGGCACKAHEGRYLISEA